MATYQVSGPGGAVYRIDGPEGADPSAIIGAIHGQAASATASPNAPQGWLGDIALGGRDVGEGVLDTLGLPVEALEGANNLISRLSNRYLGTHFQMVAPFSTALSNALTAAGAPVATTPGQKLASAAIKGGVGALTGLGALGLPARAIASANALRAGAAGLTGGASSEMAREAGAGPTGQVVAGLAGGLTPAALEGGIGLTGSLVRPFTRAGQTQLAANVLRREATNPQAAASNLQSAQPLVPGSLRTAGEASGDPGILALEKGIRARNPGPFGARISSQNAARQTELTGLGGTPADIAAAERLRDSQTAPMRDVAFTTARAAREAAATTVPTGPENLDEFLASDAAQEGKPAAPSVTAPVHETIDRILDSPAGAREGIGKTMRWARGLIGDHTDPETLYEVRKDLALAQQDKLQPSGRDAPNATMLAQARGELGQVIRSLDDTIESEAPGYKAYLQRYSELSQPIDQMEAIQRLQQKASSGLDTTTGHPFLSAPQFSRQLATTLDRAHGPMALRLSAPQLKRLSHLGEDLRRGSALSSPTVKTPGSDTFQNFMTGRRLGGGLVGHVPLVGKYLRGVNDFVDQRVNEALSNAMLDPQKAAAMLLKGQPRVPWWIALARAARTRKLAPYLAGPAATLPGTVTLPPAFPGAIPQRMNGLVGMR